MIDQSLKKLNFLTSIRIQRISHAENGCCLTFAFFNRDRRILSIIYANSNALRTRPASKNVWVRFLLMILTDVLHKTVIKDKNKNVMMLNLKMLSSILSRTSKRLKSKLTKKKKRNPLIFFQSIQYWLNPCKVTFASIRFVVRNE